MRAHYFVFLILLLVSCNQDKEIKKDFECVIRMERDPGRINPFFSPTSLGREVYQYIYTPLADYHPDNLELYPILVESIPEGYDTVIGDQTFRAYDIDIRDDAKWSDGKSITNIDYYFTVQTIKHPESKIQAWKPYFTALKDIELSQDDSTKLSVIFDSDYMLSKEVALTTFLMPSHVFDPTGILCQRDIIASEYEISDSLEIKVLEKINASINNKQNVIQSGPYKLTDFQTDEYIILEAKEDYWAGENGDNIFLQQGPKKIVMRIVPDELAAINMAKESQLDFVRLKSSNHFLELKKDSSFASDWNFHVPQIMQYYFLMLNNTSEILKSKNVRNALSHLADVDDYIQNVDGGLGTRTIGHFNPAKPYYNDEIEAIPFDPEKAKQILSDDGWTDLDGDDVLDKNIDGELKSLEFEILITGSQLSQNISLLFKEAAAKAGVKINIDTKKMSLIRKENLPGFNYDIVANAITADAAPDDPYSRWHSDNAIPGAKNQVGYSNPEADKYIEQIRTTRDAEERKMAYLKLQEIMHQDQPVIFLYSPMQKIIISNRLKAETTAKRPGYLANSFQLSE